MTAIASASLAAPPVNVTLLRVILSESGLNPDKVAISRFSIDQIADMVKDPSIDAFMTVGPLDSKITTDAITATARLRGEPAFLPIDVSEAIAHKHPLYESEEIPGSFFTSSPARPDDKVETVGVNHLIVAPKSLSDATVGAFTRALFSGAPSLAQGNPGRSKIEKPDTDKDAAIPAHPGAAAYIDGTERTFLDKYSDYFWGAVLLLSVLGSGIAWLRHYLKRDERSLTSEHRDKAAGAHLAGAQDRLGRGARRAAGRGRRIPARDAGLLRRRRDRRKRSVRLRPRARPVPSCGGRPPRGDRRKPRQSADSEGRELQRRSLKRTSRAFSC